VPYDDDIHREEWMQIRLSEVLTPALLEQHAGHIRDFLALEGIRADDDLGATVLNDRQIKELLEELAAS
jgi:hypothetical protein